MDAEKTYTIIQETDFAKEPEVKQEEVSAKPVEKNNEEVKAEAEVKASDLFKPDVPVSPVTEEPVAVTPIEVAVTPETPAEPAVVTEEVPVNPFPEAVPNVENKEPEIPAGVNTAIDMVRNEVIELTKELEEEKQKNVVSLARIKELEEKITELTSRLEAKEKEAQTLTKQVNDYKNNILKMFGSPTTFSEDKDINEPETTKNVA